MHHGEGEVYNFNSIKEQNEPRRSILVYINDVIKTIGLEFNLFAIKQKKNSRLFSFSNFKYSNN